MRFGKSNFCSMDVANENRSSLMACWELAKKSPESASDRYGISETYAGKIANLTSEMIEKTCNVSQAIFSFRYRESEIFQSKTDSVRAFYSDKDVEHIIAENRAALSCRWNAARTSIDDCIEKYGLSRQFAQTLASTSYSQIDRAASVRHPLLSLAFPEQLLGLISIAKDSEELTVFVVLHE